MNGFNCRRESSAHSKIVHLSLLMLHLCDSLVYIYLNDYCCYEFIVCIHCIAQHIRIHTLIYRITFCTLKYNVLLCIRNYHFGMKNFSILNNLGANRSKGERRQPEG